MKKGTLALIGLLLSCGILTANGTQEALEPSPTVSQDFQPFTVETFGQQITYDHVPERAVSLNAHTTEIMLAMGLGNKLIGTAYNNAPVLPQYREELNRIPQLAEKYPSLEVFLDADPDFVFGRSSAFKETAVGTVQTINDYGIMPYVCKGSYTTGATMDDVYEDFTVIGKTFQVEDRANSIINGMKDQIANVKKTIDNRQPIRVFVLDATGDTAFTACQGLQTSLIEAAGGKNIFDDIDKTWARVSWEEVVDRNPELIIINEYGSTPSADKIAFARELPAMAEVEAVKNNRFLVIDLPAVFPGIRNADTVEKFAEAFYPDLF